MRGAAMGIALAMAGCMTEPGGVSRALSIEGWDVYGAGDFGRAGSMFQAAIATNPFEADAHAGLGRLALQKLDLITAWPHFERALEYSSRHPQALEDLALSYHMLGEFERAAQFYERMGAMFKPIVEMLRSFGDSKPYRVTLPADEVRVPLSASDPLPVVEVSVGGKGPYRFYIDTGAAEVFVDSALAKELGLRDFGEVQGLFPGGGTRPVSIVRLPSLELGGVRVEDLPGNTMDLSAASAQLGRPIHGILGVHFLMRFTATIDYRRGGALVLRRKERVWNLPGERLPFVIVGDHYLLTRGSINGVPVLWFVDTGFAGEVPIAATGSALMASGVRVGTGKVLGQGGGGSHVLRTFVAESVAVGGVKRERVPGLTDVMPGVLERRFRVRIGGMLGHGFFRRGALTIDFREMIMLLEE